MGFFTVTSQNNQQTIINSNTVSKVVDFGAYRTIYQGSDTNNYQVKDTLAQLLTLLKTS